MTTEAIELSAGTIDYQDTGGDGPVVVLLHGLLMDATLWDAVTAELRSGHRCLVPTLPMGAHARPMREDADLTPKGLARLVGEFLERLDLRDVTLVGNDTGGALVQLLIAQGAERVGAVVLASCDAYDNFPPGLTGRTVVMTGKLPPALFGLFMQQMRIKPVRRLPIAFGWLTKRGDAVTARWMRPILSQAGVRRDAVKVLRGIAADRHVLEAAAESLPAFDRPARVVWAERDRVMPPDHGRRLAEALPRARLVVVPDSYTLLALDQPGALAEAIRDASARP
ncbi:alpha/beta fold hydrolase [Actinacidiphila paucisporea]|uniref:Pimeloyl-ACP methyl ester carboxylesterase n=1 Tax=Actinacidiphila paucisporea TaxID=310782 RepID=A0A1M7NAL9_9ACTN|nr:alpha/beta hydrolase [Actinacidiphila paucisporea]SHN00561.1 Pimeloyl-ACP methyl ester carboxylesterase [Actinacidiphila paucisporea]